MEQRDIKFRRVHFIDEQKTIFHHCDEWGVNVGVGTHVANFVSPSTNNAALWFTDFQYTGFKDKEGVGIYEGDGFGNIPQLHCYVVRLDNGEWVLKFIDKRCKPISILDHKVSKSKITWNIYENPDLLNHIIATRIISTASQISTSTTQYE